LVEHIVYTEVAGETRSIPHGLEVLVIEDITIHPTLGLFHGSIENLLGGQLGGQSVQDCSRLSRLAEILFVVESGGRDRD
jgi:hypothetical protein